MSEEITSTSAVTETTPSVETTSTSTGSGAPAGITESAVNTAPGANTSVEASAAASWTPNYKFKAAVERGDQKEFEFEDWAKKIVNQENEEKLRQLYCKAYGLDYLKERYQNTRQITDQLTTENSGYKAAFEEAKMYIKSGDYGSLLQGLGISKKDIYQWVYNDLEQANMPHEQRMALQAQQQERQRLYQLEQQNQQLSQNYQNTMVQMREFQLDTVLQSNEVAQVAADFNAQMGNPDAFRNEVIKRGVAYAQIGQDISAQQAVAEVLQLINAAKQQTQVDQPGITNQATQAQAVTQKKPVIPAVGGKNSSPIKKSPKSLDEIRKLSASL